jgi:DNA-binding FadR family transcriptional regulator
MMILMVPAVVGEESMIEITPVLDSKNDKPMYIQLADYIKQEILSGRIKPKEKLPSKRNFLVTLD